MISNRVGIIALPKSPSIIDRSFDLFQEEPINRFQILDRKVIGCGQQLGAGKRCVFSPAGQTQATKYKVHEKYALQNHTILFTQFGIDFLACCDAGCMVHYFENDGRSRPDEKTDVVKIAFRFWILRTKFQRI